MVKSFDIAKKNLKTLFRDRKGLLFLILMPIFYYGLMGIIFGGGNDNISSQLYQIGWVDMDNSESNNPNKDLNHLFSILNETDLFELQIIESNVSASKILDSGEIDAYIIIPDGFELYINGSGPEPTEFLQIYFRTSTPEISKTIISSSIMGVIDGVVNYNPLALDLKYENKTIIGGKIGSLSLGTPGYLMYGILSSLSGGVILLTSERKDGLLKRLESSRIAPKDMMMGHLISNTVIVFLQFMIGIIILSLFGFKPFYHDFLSLIIGVIFTVLLLSFFQNALALVASAIFKTPEASAGGVWLILIPLMTFSGAFFPLELVAPKLIPYVSWIPTRIVVVLFEDLMVNALSLWSWVIIRPFLYIALETFLFFLLGMKMYRKFAQSTD